MTTKAEIRNQALSLLGRLRLGQSPQDQDKVSIEKAYDEVYEGLKTIGIATWASTAEVPNDITPHVVAMVAMARADTYGVSDSRYARIQNRYIVAEREIRKLVTPKYESLEESDDY